MNLSYIEYIGFFAAFLTTLSTLPQFLSTYKTKNVEGVSLNMFLMLGSGILLWLVYGILKQDWVLILANLVTLILVVLNIIFIFKYR